MADDNCVFCALAAGRVAASMVHEDDQVVAFMDHQPVTPGHVLVVPRTHAQGLEDLSDDAGSLMWALAHRVGRALRRSGLRCEGVNMFLADGRAAFQEVFHVHLHVFPRFAGDGFTIGADWQVRERDVLDEAAAAVKTGLRRRGQAPGAD